jgi:hypothetical protein
MSSKSRWIARTIFCDHLLTTRIAQLPLHKRVDSMAEAEEVQEYVSIYFSNICTIDTLIPLRAVAETMAVYVLSRFTLKPNIIDSPQAFRRWTSSWC